LKHPPTNPMRFLGANSETKNQTIDAKPLPKKAEDKM
jgi:hypothetical protein